MLRKNINVELEYQPPIAHPPMQLQHMHQNTVANDTSTINFWKDIWVRNIASNKEKFGSFLTNGLHKLYRIWDKQPVILMGSGPSLKQYAKYLIPHTSEDGVQRKGNPGIKVMSALHNFAYLTDLGVHVDYWVTLDGGEVVIDEMFDGATKKIPSNKIIATNLMTQKFAFAKKSENPVIEFEIEAGQSIQLDISFKEKLQGAVDQKLIKIEDVPDQIDKEFYRNAAKNQKLIAYIGTNPRLWDNWLGEVYWCQSIMPNPDLKRKMDEIEKYELIVSSGGNVLGASMYIAKAIFGCNPCIFMGADFSFSYDKRFHSFDSKYDTVGQGIRVRDIYGNAVWSWSSYYGFKMWFDLKSMQVPGIYINCSDGCMGAYENGNIISIIQKHIEDVLEMYRMVDYLKEECENPGGIASGKVLF